MKIFHYITSGGKDVIKHYIDSLPKEDEAEAIEIELRLKSEGIKFLNTLDIKPLKGTKKLYEIRWYKLKHRFFYVLVDGMNIYILHACKKQKDGTQNKDVEVAKKRAKELGKELKKDFI